jgi:hypothetical protein
MMVVLVMNDSATRRFVKRVGTRNYVIDTTDTIDTIECIHD